MYKKESAQDQKGKIITVVIGMIVMFLLITLSGSKKIYAANMRPISDGYYMLMATLDGNTKTLLPVSELPCILSLIQ